MAVAEGAIPERDTKLAAHAWMGVRIEMIARPLWTGKFTWSESTQTLLQWLSHSGDGASGRDGLVTEQGTNG